MPGKNLEGISINQRNVLNDIYTRKHQRSEKSAVISNMSVLQNFFEAITPRRELPNDYKDEVLDVVDPDTGEHRSYRLPNLGAAKARRYLITSTAIRSKGMPPVRHVVSDYSRPQTAPVITESVKVETTNRIASAAPSQTRTIRNQTRKHAKGQQHAEPKEKRTIRRRSLIPPPKPLEPKQTVKSKQPIHRVSFDFTPDPKPLFVESFRSLEKDYKRYHPALERLFPVQTQQVKECDEIMRAFRLVQIPISRSTLERALVEPLDIEKEQIHLEQQKTVDEDNHDESEEVKKILARNALVVQPADPPVPPPGSYILETTNNMISPKTVTRWTAREYREIREHIRKYRDDIKQKKLEAQSKPRYISQAVAHAKLADIASDLTKRPKPTPEPMDLRPTVLKHSFHKKKRVC
ncbi:hypothetical protein EDD86DRAFT_248916 [Gorgonomyces haynaldii]|nr:hypothetical protein EDD86DRAFT_248916 [Gorgonomyces haynaldii]